MDLYAGVGGLQQKLPVKDLQQKTTKSGDRWQLKDFLFSYGLTHSRSRYGMEKK